MKVILQKDIPGTGKKGDVKDLAEGYVQNYLLPAGLVRAATTIALKERDQGLKKSEKKEEKELKEAQKIAARIDGAMVEVKGKGSNNGTLYAGITPDTIAKALYKHYGAKVAASQVRLKGPLKTVGDHLVSIHLPHGLEVDITVQIAAE